MWKSLTTAILAAALLFTSAQAAEYSPAEMARKLDASVALLDLGQGHCTATKVAPKTWLTARHCIGAGLKIETARQYLYPRSIVLAWQEKKGGNRSEDWAIINTQEADDSVPSLSLGCNETIYPGMAVAYLGYPAGVDRAYVQGYISSIRRVRYGGNQADWVIDMTLAGGSSGSAIVSMATGNILGVLTEGTLSSRTGFFMSAAESVKNLDWCEDYNKNIQHQGDDTGPALDLDADGTIS